MTSFTYGLNLGPLRGSAMAMARKFYSPHENEELGIMTNDHRAANN
jgi:hypothetical protein